MKLTAKEITDLVEIAGNELGKGREPSNQFKSAVTQLITGLLTDINRIADALEKQK